MHATCSTLSTSLSPLSIITILALMVRGQPKRQQKSKVIDMEVVKVINRRGRVDYGTVVVQEESSQASSHAKIPRSNTGSPSKRMRSPSDTLQNNYQEDNEQHRTKKVRNTRKTKVRLLLEEWGNDLIIIYSLRMTLCVNGYHHGLDTYKNF